MERFLLNHRASCSADVGRVLQQEGNYFDDQVAVGIDSLGRRLFQFADLQNPAAAIVYLADKNIRLHKNIEGKREGDVLKIRKPPSSSNLIQSNFQTATLQ
ncbi:hypothetical protein KQX54_002105 [Cotesia glomerata]|uniref:Uncharacterized protein n=1 Tax=Cotesia glomerata TaxID=32391 RepID=A0AAV7I4S5_COTGL|nr:hypothetical protein KQX54_002105 [Cotesia glomerata]